jgi:predicted metal-dependent phosphoesterase TrpH
MNRYRTIPSGAPNATRTEEAVLLDMHVHSDYSVDSVVSVDAILRAWERTGILPLVCDHNSIEGSRKVYTQIRRQNPDIPLILAEEISTREGEIIGAFLTEKIPPGLSAAETLDRIRDQGGLSIVPHPFCTHRLCTIDRGVLQESIGRIDVVEGYNARNRSPEADVQARAFAREHKKPVSAGSDAHTPTELAGAYVAVAPFEGPEDLLANLKDAPACFLPADSSVPSVAKRIGRFRRTVG